MVQTLFNATGSSVPEDAIKSFAATITGAVLQDGDPGYDETRTVFNGMIDRRPGLIVQPAETADVQKAVKFARDHNLLVSVQSGGHSVQGYGVCDGGLMIEFSKMKGIKVDPQSQTCVAEAGVRWGEFDAATQEHGLAVTGGRVPSTGIAGLTLGSGSGWLERKLGFTVDNLLGAEVVLASGEVVRASESENTDLFWGIRGGGGNFGIVTRFEMKLHKIGPVVYGGLLAFPRSSQVVKVYRDFLENAPEELGSGLALMTAPHEEFVPPPVRGMPVMGIVICYAGDPEKGPEVIKPLLDLGPALNMVQPMPYVEVQKLLEAGNPPGLRNYWKADFYQEMPDEAIDKVMEAASQPVSPLSVVLLAPNTGAMQRVPEDATALGWRSAKWSVHVLGAWENAADDEKNIAWVRGISDAMSPWAQKAAYLNYLMDEGEQRVKDSFGAKYDRMVALKDKYDPGNFFRLNQNIKPSGA